MTKDCPLNYNKNTSSAHVVYTIFLNVKTQTKINLCTQHVLNLYFSCNSVNNLLSYNGLINTRMRASDKDLPVRRILWEPHHNSVNLTGLAPSCAKCQLI